MADKSKENDERISKILNDTKLLTRLIQIEINKALLNHKRADNPVCGMKDGKIFWVQPEDIIINEEDILNLD